MVESVVPDDHSCDIPREPESNLMLRFADWQSVDGFIAGFCRCDRRESVQYPLRSSIDLSWPTAYNYAFHASLRDVVLRKTEATCDSENAWADQWCRYVDQGCSSTLILYCGYSYRNQPRFEVSFLIVSISPRQRDEYPIHLFPYGNPKTFDS